MQNIYGIQNKKKHNATFQPLYLYTYKLKVIIAYIAI